MDKDIQTLLYETMADPAFYPHQVSHVSLQETHISMVFLTGDYVYKIKKPVDLGFVDFRSLEKRRFFCEQEVRLNRRLTTDVYLEVVSLTWDGHEFAIGGDGRTVEYAIRMRQLSPAHTMGHLLENNEIGEPDLGNLSAKLVEFHQNTPPVVDQPIWSFVKAACDENFSQVQPYSGSLLDSAHLKAILHATHNIFEQNRPLFDHRTASGKIRDGHGDLRAEHIYYTDDGKIQILDCIEFNDRLRRVDVASDLAFLAMDLDYLQRPELARFFLEAYCRISGDASLLSLMDFYQCYRAMVRCKVNCIQLSNPGINRKQRHMLSNGAVRYLQLAYTYARRMSRPTLWIFCGLPASGKSAVASALARELCIESLNSDRVRKKRFGLAPHDCASERVDGGIYSTEINQWVYDQLLQTARMEIEKGHSVILDATYRASAQREKILKLADVCCVAIVFVECTADEAVLRDRLRRRELTPSVSDARLHHFESIKSRFEPLTEIPPSQHIHLDTTWTMSDCLNSLFIKRYLDRVGEV